MASESPDIWLEFTRAADSLRVAVRYRDVPSVVERQGGCAVIVWRLPDGRVESVEVAERYEDAVATMRKAQNEGMAIANGGGD